MNITIKASDLLKGLKGVRGTIEKRTTIPILSNVMIEAKDGAIQLRGTDLDIEVSLSVPALVHENWQCLRKTGSGAPIHPLARGVHRLPRDKALEPWS